MCQDFTFVSEFESNEIKDVTRRMFVRQTNTNMSGGPNMGEIWYSRSAGVTPTVLGMRPHFLSDLLLQVSMACRRYNQTAHLQNQGSCFQRTVEEYGISMSTLKDVACREIASTVTV